MADMEVLPRSGSVRSMRTLRDYDTDDDSLPDRMASSSSVAASSSTCLRSNDLQQPLPTLPVGALTVWDSNGGVAERGVLRRPHAAHYTLHAAQNGSWLPLTVDRSSAKGVPPFFRGYLVSTTPAPTDRSRFYMMQPTPALNAQRICLQSQCGHDSHMGWLLFIGNSLCERAVCRGTTGCWERLEVRPFPRHRYEDTHFEHCFQLWSVQRKLPVCWSRSRTTGRHKFSLPTKYNFSKDIVVFILRDWDLEVATTPDSSNNGPGVMSRIAGLPSRITRSTINVFWSTGNMFANFNLMGYIGNSLSMARPSAATSSFHSLPDDQPELVDASPFELLHVSVSDAETGEELDVGVVARGSPRVELVRFTTTRDLKDLTRLVRVKKFPLPPFSEKVVMGDFEASDEAHTFRFDTKIAPWHAPTGKWSIDVTYIAANINCPLYMESGKTFVMR